MQLYEFNILLFFKRTRLCAVNFFQEAKYANVFKLSKSLYNKIILFCIGIINLLTVLMNNKQFLLNVT